jgi:hypothetical protein
MDKRRGGDKIMKKLDFINLVTTYASHFRDLNESTEADEILVEFINYIAGNQGVDYGIYASDLEKHKRRVYNPQDSDVIINMSKQIGELNTALSTIYMNSGTPQVRTLIEHLGEKFGGDLERSVMLHKEEI